MQSGGYFINTSDRAREGGGGGYWEPHTSSIDFCETNYLLSAHVVEPHNVLSSLWGLTLPGIVGMLRGNPTGETRFAVAYGTLAVIGIGSAALHGTLHWAFQSSDELPMIYLVIAALYCCLENDATPNDPTTGRPWLPHALVSLGVVNTLVYFRFRRIYFVFLLTFASMTAAAFALHIGIALKQRRLLLAPATRSAESNVVERSNDDVRRRDNARVALRFYACHYVVFLAIAAPVWALDQLWCSKLLPLYDALPSVLRGCTLHVVWHAAAGFGAHAILQFLVACRMSVLGGSCRIRWILGAVPVVASAASPPRRHPEEEEGAERSREEPPSSSRRGRHSEPRRSVTRGSGVLAGAIGRRRLVRRRRAVPVRRDRSAETAGHAGGASVA